ncbi:alpha-beta hydrolase superfamily lysophospholipase [Catenuloplanes nepalensis]|uniref:Alpha-beta hydrolase superfamily lysophospholipase n=1 Tax=Catenuloplanes nepalensis TaxID=587533 RepID=A0ABT9N806_9ACTN|nr:alpha/beta hydrolase [Catenuloplanes nepalensis]MDP9799838.1 alpha-beta hydrolase superfamily lysophospholipase [Catenuloplanes nepalensis]
MEIDVLGEPYERRTIDLGHDDEGPVVATLVRRRSDNPDGRAVLYVHGFVDYFFQTHLAEFFTDQGWDFYALDLRKYGRSLLPHQTPNFCRSLDDYFPELDEAARIIREEDGHDRMLVAAHSTGGLIASLWADARRTRGWVDALFLNSPFFDLNLPWVVRRPMLSAVCRATRRNPYGMLPRSLNQIYGESIHADHRGEWNYNLEWKPLAGFPVRYGWLNAIRDAQTRLRRGLDVDAPILLACSARSFRGARWDEAARLADAVLNVEHIAQWATHLGGHLTLVRFDGGMHDLTLSGPEVRQRVFTEVDRWARVYVPARAPEDRGRGEGSPATTPPTAGEAPSHPFAIPADRA